jgi:glycosyltransferase involved in cell wall biosynthesis
VKALRGLNAVSTVLPDALVALSGDQEEQFRTALRVPDSRIRRIPHGIDADYFRPPTPAERETARRKFGLRPGTPTVCMIGRLDYLKGHDVLIRALARLRDRAVPVHTLLAGTGASEPNIRTLIEDEGLTETVHLLGFADSRDVLWASEVSVLPSRQEIFGLVAVESMLCGVVPVRTPCAGASEQIVDGSTGFIIPFDDDQALADRLALLLTEPARRAEMAQGALRHARTHFTSETMIDRTLSLYAEMAGRPPTLAAPLPTPAVSPSEHLGTPASSSL